MHLRVVQAPKGAIRMPGKRLKINGVYLMYSYRTRLCKIGMTNDPGARLEALRTRKGTIGGGDSSIFLYAYWRPQGSRDSALAEQLETSLHRAFKSRRVRGEWFRLTGDDVRAVYGLVARAGFYLAYSGAA